MRLTDTAIKSLVAPERGQRDYRDDTLKGFLCHVSQGSGKTFQLVHGKERTRTTLGRYPHISLADARSAARRILAERTLGKHQAPRQTFGEALELFLTHHARRGTAPDQHQSHTDWS